MPSPEWGNGEPSLFRLTCQSDVELRRARTGFGRGDRRQHPDPARSRSSLSILAQNFTFVKQPDANFQRQ